MIIVFDFDGIFVDIIYVLKMFLSVFQKSVIVGFLEKFFG